MFTAGLNIPPRVPFHHSASCSAEPEFYEFTALDGGRCPQQDCLCGPEVRVIKGSPPCHELPGAHLQPPVGGVRETRLRTVLAAGEHPMPGAMGVVLTTASLPATCSSTGAGSEGCARGVSWKPSRSGARLTLVVPVPVPAAIGSPRGDVAVPSLVPARPCQTLLPVRCSSAAAWSWAASPLGRPGARGLLCSQALLPRDGGRGMEGLFFHRRSHTF